MKYNYFEDMMDMENYYSATEAIAENNNWHPIHYTEWDTIQSNYESAMHRRRNYSINLSDYYCNPITEVKYFRKGNSIVFGVIKNDVFFVTHFAPSSMREGMKLIKSINFKVVFAVTQDLVGMLYRLGYSIIAEDVPCIFNNEYVSKTILSKHVTATALKNIMEEGN